MESSAQKVYITSIGFEYSKLITRATGPLYASDMSWLCDTLENIHKYKDYINIIDCRITPLECEQLEEVIRHQKTTPFMLTVSDPYAAKCKNDPYYKLLFRIKDLDNVCFLTKYLPIEIVKTLEEQTSAKKMVFIPYPFLDTYNQEKTLKKRLKKVVFSGSIGDIYPYRCKFRRRVKLNPLLWPKVDFLTHPGYSDIGESLRHQIIGDTYISHLANYRFMFISPSYCGLEFMKYRECAYAKTVPIGKIPYSFSDRLKEPFLEIDFDHVFSSLMRIFSLPIDELEDRASQYYSAFAAERNSEILNKKLDHFLTEHGF